MIQSQAKVKDCLKRTGLLQICRKNMRLQETDRKWRNSVHPVVSEQAQDKICATRSVFLPPCPGDSKVLYGTCLRSKELVQNWRQREIKAESRQTEWVLLEVSGKMTGRLRGGVHAPWSIPARKNIKTGKS